jgi:L-alanine-DL-glutamate epimerase-like enolase superfamily enzyme
VDDPVQMSFSQLASREMLLVEVESDGVVGLGESWVNYPSWAARERMATLECGVVPLLRGLDVSDPVSVQRQLLESLEGLARQWGAPGPVWQALSAVDMALWDLVARMQDVSVAGLLASGRTPRSRVEAYASGIGPSDVERLSAAAVGAGFRRVKARVGFGRARDEKTLSCVRDQVGDDVELFADANQAWTPAEAAAFCRWSEHHRIAWLEEPLVGNRLAELTELAAATDVALACGENLYGAAEFERYAASGAVRVIQPDLAKSGGFSLVGRLASALTPRVDLVPHCYGGAIVTAASVQLAAAFDAVPYIELDVRPNPLRDDIAFPGPVARNGWVEVPTGPGLGVELDRDRVEQFVVDRKDCDLGAMV